MRLKRLKIDGFKNLNNFELDFTEKDGTTVLIGNNGSGKSNVLEAISAIFTGLFKMSTPQRKPKFEYEIEYELNDISYKMSLVKNKNIMNYKFYKNSKVLSVGDFKSNLYIHLPSKVILSYSGEENRIWKLYYKHLHNDFLDEIKKSTSHSLPISRLLDVDGEYWNEALCVFIYSELENNKNFIKNNLKINSIETIKIEFDISKYNSFPTNSITDFIKVINPELKDKTILSVDELREMDIGYENELFTKLVASTVSNLISKLEINFNNGLKTEDLSEGQKKQILIRAILEFITDEKSLVLFDEPDSHIHVSNKGDIKVILEEYPNRDTILTTHSPTLTHSFNDKHITMIVDGKIEDKTKQEVFSHITEGIWNYQEQSIFLSSTKDIILLVEGKHDKIHIEEAFKRLKNNYHELDFDVFDMHGETNIKHMLLGLANNGIDFDDKKIIAVFDNDGAGKKGFGQNFKVIQGKEYKSLVDSNGNLSNTFYGFLLPKTDGFTGDFTIENMHTGKKNKEALQFVFEERSTDNDFFNDFIDNVSKQIKEDAKNQLANNCKNFEDTDFEHFEKLFNLIKEIKEEA